MSLLLERSRNQWKAFLGPCPITPTHCVCKKTREYANGEVGNPQSLAI